MNRELFLPTLSHWEHKNPWSGEWEQTRFRVIPDGEAMTAEVWPGPMSREFAEQTVVETFPISTQGIETMRNWIINAPALLSASEDAR